MVDCSSRDSPYRSYEKHGDEYSPHIKDTLRSLKVEIRSCKEDNHRIIHSQDRFSRAHEKQAEVNEVIFQFFLDM